MVECEEFETWYHLKCAYLKEPLPEDDHWLCVDYKTDSDNDGLL